MENILTGANYAQPSVQAAAQPAPLRHWPLLVLVLIGVFFFATVRRGQHWGDDFSMYIHHAKNLASGIAYDQTGYVYNPQFVVGPHTYPPVFPFLLAPLYKVWGLNLEIMKLVGIVTGLLGLLLVYACFKNELTTVQVAVLLALTGFMPVLCDLKDAIISDLPFFCFFYLSLYLIKVSYAQQEKPGAAFFERYGAPLLTGAAIYLAYGTRSIGVILLGALVLTDLLQHQRIQRLTYKIWAVTLPLVLLQNLLLHKDSGYRDVMTVVPLNVLNNIRAYLSEFSVLLAGGWPTLLRLGLLGLVTLFVLRGWYHSVRRQPSWFELLPLLYLTPILLISLEIQPRYLVPLLPLYFYYALRGLEFQGQSKLLTPLAAMVLLLVLGGGYARWYQHADFSPLNEGITKPETQQLAAFLRTETAAQDVFLFIKPRLLSLLTDRSAAAWHMPANESELWNYLRDIHATHIISGPATLTPDRQAYLQQFILHNQARLQELYANADYKVYRIKP